MGSDQSEVLRAIRELQDQIRDLTIAVHRLAEASPARHGSPVRVAIAGPSISVEGYPYRSNASVTSSTSADYNHLASTIPPIPESARLLATALRRSPADRVWIELPGLGRLDIGPGLFFKVGSGLLDPAHRLICPTPSTWSSERQDSLHLWSVPVGVITDTWLETSTGTHCLTVSPPLHRRRFIAQVRTFLTPPQSSNGDLDSTYFTGLGFPGLSTP